MMAADLQAVVRKNDLLDCFVGANVNVAWFVVSKPTSCRFDFPADVSYFTFPAGGKAIAQKVGSFLYSVFSASSITYGNYDFEVVATTEISWEDAVDDVKDLNPDDWRKLRAELKRAIKKRHRVGSSGAIAFMAARAFRVPHS